MTRTTLRVLAVASATCALALAGAAPASANVVDLGATGTDVGNVNVTAVNASETVVGARIVSDDCGGATGHAARWTRAGGWVDLGVIGGSAPDVSSAAWDVNDAGLVVGGSHTGAGCTGMHPFASEDGAPLVDLGVPAAADVGEGAALGVGRTGSIVGFSVKTHAASGCNTTGTAFEFPLDDCPQATFWNATAGSGNFASMAASPEHEWVIRAVSDENSMVGYEFRSGVAVGQYWALPLSAPQDLTLVPREHGINPAGTLVVGSSAGLPYAIRVASGVLGPRLALPLPEGATAGVAYAVNDREQIVGEVTTAQGQRAVLWEGPDAAPVLLDTLLPEGSGWTLRRAFDISAGGSVVGTGILGGTQHAYLLNSTIAVDSTGDEANASDTSQSCVSTSGTCTLRAAIQAANARGGKQTISFRIPGTTTEPVIAVTSALPPVKATVRFDATTQAAKRVVVDGGTGAYDGFTLDGGSAELDALTIKRFGGDGVVVTSSDNRIGGGTEEQAVTIVENGRAGLAVRSGRGNAVSEWSMVHSNAGLDIDLGPGGATNRATGSGEGPNDLLNAPMVWQAPISGLNQGITGRMSGAPNATYRIDVVINACGPRRAGDPVRSQSDTVTTSDNGEAVFRPSLVNFNPPSGSTVMARATQLDAAGKPVQTSQYGNCGWDRDEDRVLDEWETKGADPFRTGAVTVDLPAMGASPTKKDLFLEVDWMAGKEIGPAAVEQVETAFAKAPIGNPDGSTGINLHIDAGPGSTMNLATKKTWGGLSGGTQLTTMPNLGRKNGKEYDWSQFDQVKRSSFARERTPMFHYAISAVAIGGLPTTLGIARDIPASDFLLGLKAACPAGTDCTPTQIQQAGTLMHEFGHTLGMKHGGEDHVNKKPNYLSIMNYSFAFAGLVTSTNGKDRTDGLLDYSRFGSESLGDLDEIALDETVGFGVKNPEVKKFVTTMVCYRNRRVSHVSVWMAVRAVDFNCNGRANEKNVLAVIDLETPNIVGYKMRPHDNWRDDLTFGAGAMLGDEDVSLSSGAAALDGGGRNVPAEAERWPTRAQLLLDARTLVGDSAAPVATTKVTFRKRRGKAPLTVVAVRAVDARAIDSISIQVDKLAPRAYRPKGKKRTKVLVATHVVDLKPGTHTVRVLTFDTIGNASKVRTLVVKVPKR